MGPPIPALDIFQKLKVTAVHSNPWLLLTLLDLDLCHH